MQAQTITTTEALAHLSRPGAYLYRQYGRDSIVVPQDRAYEQETGDRAEVYRITQRTYVAMQNRLEKKGLRIASDMPLTLKNEPNYHYVDSAPLLYTIQPIMDQVP